MVKSLEVAYDLQKLLLGGILMMSLNLMREIANNAILTEKEVTITMNDGHVFANKRIITSDYWTIVTHDDWIIQWWEVCSIV